MLNQTWRPPEDHGAWLIQETLILALLGLASLIGIAGGLLYWRRSSGR